MFLSNCFRNVLNKSHLKSRFSARNFSKQPSKIITSKVDDIQIPQYLIQEYVWANLDKWPNKTALVCAETGRNYTYTQLYKKSRFLAVSLRKSFKLQYGDTIAVILPIIPEYIIATLGALTAALKVTTVNPNYTANEISKQLTSSNAKLIITVADNFKVAKEAANLRSKENIPIITINHKGYQHTPEGAIKFDDICTEETVDIFWESPKFDDVAFLPYSSGTTGLPKGVELTHNNVISNLYQIKDPAFKLTQDTGDHQDVVPCILPLFHIYGLIVVILHVLPLGCKVVTIPKFGTNIFIKMLEEHRPHVLYAVPPIILMMLNNANIKYAHLETIRTIMSSAAPLGAADIERFNEKSKGKVNILQMYGMTEASPLILCQTDKLKGGIKIGGSGMLLPNTKAKIVDVNDSTNTCLGPLKSGELIIKGPQVMKGYYKNKVSTTETIVDHGWLRTGDIGHYDEDGQFFITDRLKELIKVKGFQVAPAELEEILRDHPDVADAAVIGVAHSAFGEVPKAFVVLKNKSVTATHLEEYVASKVTSYKRLVGGVVLMDSIPKTASGKILRRELKNM